MRPRERRTWVRAVVIVGVTGVLQVACVREPPPVAPENSPPPPVPEGFATPPPRSSTPPPPPPAPPPDLPLALSPDEEFASRTLEELNRESPLEPVFYALDSSDLDERARRSVEANVDVLQRYPTWVVTIEGHCDERGTPEYNLGLGERRAMAAREYLLELGVDPERVRTVSYGKEFPFDPGHDEGAWAANRRAHFVITAK